jgi:hypothetical protein
MVQIQRSQLLGISLMVAAVVQVVAIQSLHTEMALLVVQVVAVTQPLVLVVLVVWVVRPWAMQVAQVVEHGRSRPKQVVAVAVLVV